MEHGTVSTLGESKLAPHHSARLNKKLGRRALSPFPILLLAFSMLVMMHNVTTPVFEAPDEVWHYNYVRWLAEGHGLPSMENDKSGAHQEVAQPPLYYALAALLTKPFPDDDLHNLFWGNPGFGYQAPGPSPDNKNMLIHTSIEGLPWKGAVATVHATRMTTLIFGIWTLVALWYLSLDVFRNRKSALICVSLVAFHPQFVFICSIVSNDTATAALCTTALWSIVRAARRNLGITEVIIAGLTIGAAILCKTSALLLIPLGGITLLYFALQIKLAPAKIIQRLAIFGGCVLLAGSWWYVRNAILYNDPIGITSHIDTPWGRTAPVSYWQLMSEIPLLLRSFWAAYGWGHITWSNGFYYVLWGISSLYFIASFAGVVQVLLIKFHFTKNISSFQRSDVRKNEFVLLAFCWLGMITIALLSWMRQVQAPHGRLLFPAIGAWGLILAHGMVKIAKRGGYHKVLTKLFLYFIAVLSILAPGVRIIPAFAQPRLKPAADISLATPALTFNHLARVYDVTFQGYYHTPGDTVRVRACWEALQPITVDYTVFIHLIGPNNMRAAERHTYPGLGRYPTTLWESGKTFCETYVLQIEEWATTPILYQLEIGLFNTETGERLEATNHLGYAQEPPVVGLVPVLAKTIEIGPVTPMSIKFDEQIVLTGVDTPLSGEPGQSMDVTLYWKALKTPEAQLITFVHLWQPSTSQPVAQDDSIPNEGWFPTEAWRKNIDVSDKHHIDIPFTAKPGVYPIWAGVYRAGDGTRLRAVGPEGPYVNDLVPIGEITIK